MSRTYFFREEVGYSHRERLNRLHVADFQNPDLDPISNLIEATSLTAAELQAANKNEVYQKIQQNLDVSWEEFVQKIFRLRGEEGDLFNLKLYFGTDIAYDTLHETASEQLRDEQDPEDLYDERTRTSLYDLKERGDGVLDLRFVVPNLEESEVPEDDDTSPPVNNIFAEARVYTEQGAIAISRRAMDSEDISKIRNIIETWSEGDIDPQPQLTPNEMLALENAMDGKNIGIDYSHFKGGRNIEKARYSGASNLSPLNSEIVRPASLNGQIVKLKFEHRHNTENHSWDVKIRFQYECKMSATKETTPSCVDQLVDNLVNIREHRELLRTITDRLEEYRWKIIGQSPAGGIRSYLTRRNLALRTAVDSHVDDSKIESVEVQMFRDLFFSIGVELLNTEQIKNPPNGPVPDGPEERAHLEKLFDDYARYHLEDPNYNFDRLWVLLHGLLTSDFTSPIDLIETAESNLGI